MKQLLFVLAILTIAFCPSCSNSTANNPTGGNAVFSYNLDGTKISGGEVDDLLMNNAAFLTGSSDNNKTGQWPVLVFLTAAILTRS